MAAELSSRELEVARLVARGHTNAQIATVLGISPLTAKWHVSEILRKFGVSRRVQLALAVHERGLLGAKNPPLDGVTRNAADS
jgi:two-component system response regulator DevR